MITYSPFKICIKSPRAIICEQVIQISTMSNFESEASFSVAEYAAVSLTLTAQLMYSIRFHRLIRPVKYTIYYQRPCTNFYAMAPNLLLMFA